MYTIAKSNTQQVTVYHKASLRYTLRSDQPAAHAVDTVDNKVPSTTTYHAASVGYSVISNKYLVPWHSVPSTTIYHFASIGYSVIPQVNRTKYQTQCIKYQGHNVPGIVFSIPLNKHQASHGHSVLRSKCQALDTVQQVPSTNQTPNCPSPSASLLPNACRAMRRRMNRTDRVQSDHDLFIKRMKD